MTVDIAAAVAGVVGQLTAAGIRAVSDPRDVNTPGVLVQPPSIEWRFGKAGMTLTYEVWVLVADTGRKQALDAASDLVTQVQTALRWGVSSARPDNFTLPDGSTPAGYVLTLTETVR